MTAGQAGALVEGAEGRQLTGVAWHQAPPTHPPVSAFHGTQDKLLELAAATQLPAGELAPLLRRNPGLLAAPSHLWLANMGALQQQLGLPLEAAQQVVASHPRLLRQPAGSLQQQCAELAGALGAHPALGQQFQALPAADIAACLRRSSHAAQHLAYLCDQGLCEVAPLGGGSSCVWAREVFCQQYPGFGAWQAQAERRAARRRQRQAQRQRTQRQRQLEREQEQRLLREQAQGARQAQQQANVQQRRVNGVGRQSVQQQPQQQQRWQQQPSSRRSGAQVAPARLPQQQWQEPPGSGEPAGGLAYLGSARGSAGGSSSLAHSGSARSSGSSGGGRPPAGYSWPLPDSAALAGGDAPLLHSTSLPEVSTWQPVAPLPPPPPPPAVGDGSSRPGGGQAARQRSAAAASRGAVQLLSALLCISMQLAAVPCAPT